MKVKICGMRFPEDIEAANLYRPDYVGFIFYPPSFRNITKEEAAALKGQLDDGIEAVGVFVDEPVERILDYYNSGAFDIAQLHGGESPEMVSELRGKGIPVIKALRVKDEESFKALDGYEPDMFLFDVYSKKGVGGTGEAFNWGLVDKYTGDVPFLLAGGIGLDNVKDAIAKDPYGLDISSGAETDRRKDPKKIRELLEIIRGEGE